MTIGLYLLSVSWRAKKKEKSKESALSYILMPKGHGIQRRSSSLNMHNSRLMSGGYHTLHDREGLHYKTIFFDLLSITCICKEIDSWLMYSTLFGKSCCADKFLCSRPLLVVFDFYVHPKSSVHFDSISLHLLLWVHRDGRGIRLGKQASETLLPCLQWPDLLNLHHNLTYL